MADRKPISHMPCEEFAKLASLSYEHPIGIRDKLRMAWHRVICIYCRRWLNQVKKIHRLLAKDGTRAPMPEPMKQQIRKHLEKSG